MVRDDTCYLSDRSFIEAVRAIQADHPAAAAAHHRLCVLYAGRVLERLSGDAVPDGPLFTPPRSGASPRPDRPRPAG